MSLLLALLHLESDGTSLLPDKDVKVASEFLSPREFVATINDVLSTKSTSVKVTVDEMDVDTFDGLRGQIWDELWTKSVPFLNLLHTVSLTKDPLPLCRALTTVPVRSSFSTIFSSH